VECVDRGGLRPRGRSPVRTAAPGRHARPPPAARGVEDTDHHLHGVVRRQLHGARVVVVNEEVHSARAPVGGVDVEVGDVGGKLRRGGAHRAPRRTHKDQNLVAQRLYGLRTTCAPPGPRRTPHFTTVIVTILPTGQWDGSHPLQNPARRVHLHRPPQRGGLRTRQAAQAGRAGTAIRPVRWTSRTIEDDGNRGLYRHFGRRYPLSLRSAQIPAVCTKSSWHKTGGSSGCDGIRAAQGTNKDCAAADSTTRFAFRDSESGLAGGRGLSR
jgi:hypothetical protein